MTLPECDVIEERGCFLKRRINTELIQTKRVESDIRDTNIIFMKKCFDERF